MQVRALGYWNPLNCCLLFIVAVCVAPFGVMAWMAGARETTCSSISPDQRFEILLIDQKYPFIDRNFRILLHDLEQGTTSRLFQSPDESVQCDSDRFIWSKDGRYFLLVGPEFFVHDDHRVMLKTGEFAYYLYNLSTKEAWCNASQQRDLSRVITKAQLEEIDFVEEVEWQHSEK